MPVPQQRDPEVTRKKLASWFRGVFPAADDLSVEVDLPKGLGFSNETLLVDVVRREGGRELRSRLVVRVAPTAYRVLPASRLDEEYRVLSALAATDVPVPAVLGHEPDPGVLGAPFYAMARVDGWVPPDLPSYHRSPGPVADLAPADQVAMWWGGIDVLTRVHRVDVAAAGLSSLRESPHSPFGEAAQLDYYEGLLEHFGCAETKETDETLRYLRATLPPPPEQPCLLWGDARLGNILYSGVTPAAVLDWEMTGLGSAESDLGWFLYFDRHLSEGVGAERLPALPGRSETVDRYEELTGRRVRHLDWYELFAGFRFTLIATRVSRLLVEHGMASDENEIPLARNARRLLHRVLRETAG